jgi:hypothetical protein
MRVMKGIPASCQARALLSRLVFEVNERPFARRSRRMVLHDMIFIAVPQMQKAHAFKLLHNLATSEITQLLRKIYQLRDPRQIDQIGVPLRIIGGHVKGDSGAVIGVFDGPCKPRPLLASQNSSWVQE